MPNEVPEGLGEIRVGHPQALGALSPPYGRPKKPATPEHGNLPPPPLTRNLPPPLILPPFSQNFRSGDPKGGGK